MIELLEDLEEDARILGLLGFLDSWILIDLDNEQINPKIWMSSMG